VKDGRGPVSDPEPLQNTVAAIRRGMPQGLGLAQVGDVHAQARDAIQPRASPMKVPWLETRSHSPSRPFPLFVSRMSTTPQAPSLLIHRMPTRVGERT